MRPLRCRTAAWVIAAVGLAACPKPRGGQADAGVFTPPAFDAGIVAGVDGGGAGSQEIGQACSGGPGACKSGVCLHYLPSATGGFVCSKKCAADAECPAGWACQSVYPGPGNEFCVPPRSWGT